MAETFSISAPKSQSIGDLISGAFSNMGGLFSVGGTLLKQTSTPDMSKVVDVTNKTTVPAAQSSNSLVDNITKLIQAGSGLVTTLKAPAYQTTAPAEVVTVQDPGNKVIIVPGQNPQYYPTTNPLIVTSGQAAQQATSAASPINYTPWILLGLLVIVGIALTNRR